jgi:hypothetical protein
MRFCSCLAVLIDWPKQGGQSRTTVLQLKITGDKMADLSHSLRELRSELKLIVKSSKGASAGPSVNGRPGLVLGDTDQQWVRRVVRDAGAEMIGSHHDILSGNYYHFFRANGSHEAFATARRLYRACRAFPEKHPDIPHPPIRIFLVEGLRASFAVPDPDEGADHIFLPLLFPRRAGLKNGPPRAAAKC